MAAMAPQRTLDGEVAVVTGGAGGIGEAVARTFAGAGARVCVADADADRAVAVAAALGEGHLGLALDVTDGDAVRAAVATVTDALGTPSVLFNGAGINLVVPTVELAAREWDRTIDVNLSGSFRCCQAFGTPMVDAGHGAIVNVASLTGLEFGGGGRVSYAASKGGIQGLTRALAVEWAPRGVHVNAIAPGIVLTPLVQRLADEGSLDLAELSSRVPLGRVATPEDMAGVTLMLVSPAGAYIIGQTLIVDGGLSSQGPRDTSRDEGAHVPPAVGRGDEP
jgi:NAD(P)-dependent dehydrogenase (short-subunit alcohol dehydrogenase family)